MNGEREGEMFGWDRFTDRVRKVIQLANKEARRFNHEYLGTERILLGLIKEGTGVAANVLKSLDLDLQKIRLETEKFVRSGPDINWRKLPLDERARQVIIYSLEEARNLNHNYVGTEHLLLGLVREKEGVAAKVLGLLGIELADLRREILALLGHQPKPKSPWDSAKDFNAWLDTIEQQCSRQISTAELLNEARQHHANVLKSVATKDFEEAAKHRQLRDKVGRTLCQLLN